MPGETPTLKIPYALEADKPPSVPVITKSLAEKLEALLLGIPPSHITGGAAGQLIVVGNTGAGAFKAMKGDATIAEDGTLTIGSEAVGTSKLANNAVTTAKVSLGAIVEALLGDGAVTSRKAKMTTGVAHAGADLGLTGSYSNVPEAAVSITPAVASVALVTAVFDFDFASGGEFVALGTLKVGTAEPEAAAARLSHGGTTSLRATVVQTYLVALEAGKSTTLQLQAKMTTGANGFARAPSTRLEYILLAS